MFTGKFNKANPRYNIGDLVSPTIRCGGAPGGTRCKAAMVIGIPNKKSDCYTIVCPCGIGMEYELHLDPIKKR